MTPTWIFDPNDARIWRQCSSCAFTLSKPIPDHPLGSPFWIDEPGVGLQGNYCATCALRYIEEARQALVAVVQKIDASEEFRKANEQMHVLWTWAVGLPGYDKRAWHELEARILELKQPLNRSTRKDV